MWEKTLFIQFNYRITSIRASNGCYFNLIIFFHLIFLLIQSLLEFPFDLWSFVDGTRMQKQIYCELCTLLLLFLLFLVRSKLEDQVSFEMAIKQDSKHDTLTSESITNRLIFYSSLWHFSEDLLYYISFFTFIFCCVTVNWYRHRFGLRGGSNEPFINRHSTIDSNWQLDFDNGN